MLNPDVNVASGMDELVIKLIGYFAAFKEATLDKRSAVTIGLSGGSLVDILAKTFPRTEMYWPHIRFFFCDERIVPFSDESASTFAAFNKKVMPAITGKVNVNQFVVINPELSPELCAADYDRKLKEMVKDKGNGDLSFDLLLLGLGPDGHTCSLFPGHPLLQDDEDSNGSLVSWIVDSPKPPPKRITLNFNAIRRASRIVFVVTGATKADVVKQILEDPDCKLPGALVQKAARGSVTWFMDRDAASKLDKKSEL